MKRNFVIGSSLILFIVLSGIIGDKALNFQDYQSIIHFMQSNYLLLVCNLVSAIVFFTSRVSPKKYVADKDLDVQCKKDMDVIIVSAKTNKGTRKNSFNHDYS